MVEAGVPVVLDLDRTIWDCIDVKGNPIWAKEMVQPWKRVEADRVIDSRQSSCHLHDGVRSFLTSANNVGLRVGFLSIGGLWEVPKDSQPTVQLLKEFGIYDCFGGEQLLFFKTERKKVHLGRVGKCVFIDDDDRNLADARCIDNVRVIDRKSFGSWRELL